MNATLPESDRTVLGIVTAVGLLVVVSVVVVFAQGEPETLDGSTPEGVVQRYSSAVIAGDDSQAVDYLVPELREACTLDPAITADSLRLSLVDTTLRGTNATVTVSLVTSYDDAGPFGASEYRSEEAFALDRVDGAWLIRSTPWPLTICTVQSVPR